MHMATHFFILSHRSDSQSQCTLSHRRQHPHFHHPIRRIRRLASMPFQQVKVLPTVTNGCESSSIWSIVMKLIEISRLDYELSKATRSSSLLMVSSTGGSGQRIGELDWSPQQKKLFEFVDNHFFSSFEHSQENVRGRRRLQSRDREQWKKENFSVLIIFHHLFINSVWSSFSIWEISRMSSNELEISRRTTCPYRMLDQDVAEKKLFSPKVRLPFRFRFNEYASR